MSRRAEYIRQFRLTHPDYHRRELAYQRAHPPMPERKAWSAMKQRCYNPHCNEYKYYGERGIAVCPEWRVSFLRFLADMGKRPIGLSLDRINNDGHYEPSNCRWATRSQQCRNQRRGPRKCLI